MGPIISAGGIRELFLLTLNLNSPDPRNSEPSDSIPVVLKVKTCPASEGSHSSTSSCSSCTSDPLIILFGISALTLRAPQIIAWNLLRGRCRQLYDVCSKRIKPLLYLCRRCSESSEKGAFCAPELRGLHCFSLSSLGFLIDLFYILMNVCKVSAVCA